MMVVVAMVVRVDYYLLLLISLIYVLFVCQFALCIHKFLCILVTWYVRARACVCVYVCVCV